ncbi:hypothetical protein [Tautonia rosea]|uniref:hypothetical protein n=1 Tax=Tautonia rosea TaxID=2728037 RepID=UPI0014759FEE|nr:hypothetical protein [Tautonia rosea]
MVLDDARPVYPLLVKIARELAEDARNGRRGGWITYDDLCRRCGEELSIKESPRTVFARRLKPIQAACLEHDKPDLAALVIQKPKRSDSGELLRPSAIWWEIYVTRSEAESEDVRFWFERYRTARDFDWPDEPFF